MAGGTNSSSVSAGELATALQYNNLRDDGLSTSSGHQHDGSYGHATISATTFNGTATVSGAWNFTGAMGIDSSVDADVTTFDVASTTDAIESIYLRENAGTSGTVKIHADQGTSVAEGAESVTILSDAGGVGVRSTANLANAVNITVDGGSTSTMTLFNDRGTSVTEGAASIQLLSDDGGIGIKSTANLASAILLTADGGTSETIKIHADRGTSESSIQLLSDAGGVDINAATGKDVDVAGGTVNLTSSDDAASAIYLRANAGTSETIKIHADQGTSESSIQLLSDAGGVDINAATGKDVDIAGGTVNLTSSDDAASAIYVRANAGTSETIKVHADQGTSESSIQLLSDAGGVDIDAATGKDVDIAGGTVNLTSSDNAASAIYLRANAGTSETIKIHADQGTGTGSISAVSDVGGITLDAGLDIVLSADGGNVTMDDGTSTIFDFNVDDTTLTIHDDQDTGDTAVITMAQHGALSIVTTDDDAAAANIQITADGTAELAGTTVTLDSAADIELDAGGADIFLKDDGTLFGTLTNNSGELLIKSSSSGTTAATFSGANVTFAGTVDATTDFTIGSTVVTDGVITDSSGLQLVADLDIDGTADISGDLTLSGGADGALQFANAGENSIKIPDNQASALIIEEADNAYITFVTTNCSEAITVAKATTFSAGITSTAAASALAAQNTTDAASNQVGKFGGGNRGTPTDSDEAYFSFELDNNAGAQTEFVRLTWKALDVTTSTKDSRPELQYYTANTLRELVFPAITADDTVAVLGLAQTFTAAQTINSLTLGGAMCAGNNNIDNIGNACSGWVGATLTVKSASACTSIVTETGGGCHNAVQLLKLPASGNGEASLRFFQGDASGAANNMGYSMGYCGSQGYLRLCSRDSNGSGTNAHIWRIPDGQLTIDANATWDANVFDEYDDAKVLERAFSLQHRNSFQTGSELLRSQKRELIEMGVLKRYYKSCGAECLDFLGYNDQRMAALLAGGIYQSRHKIDALAGEVRQLREKLDARCS